MNIVALVSTAARERMTVGGGWTDSFALFLLLSACISLAIAVYLLYKAPKFSPLRYPRKR